MELEAATDVGVIGLGDMGLPIAETLLDAGYTVHGYDKRDEPVSSLADAGGRPAEAPRAVASRSDAVHVVVVTREQAEDVCFGEDGVVEGFRDGDGLVVVHSSLSPGDVRAIGDEFPAGIRLIDAAVSGGVMRATEGDLTVMVGGDEAIVESYRHVLDALARTVFHLGELGSGMEAKLTNNAILYAEKAITLEILEVVAELGYDKEQLVEVYEQSSAYNYFVENFHQQVIQQPRDFPGGEDHKIANSMEVVSKFEAVADETGVETPIFDVASDRLDDLLRAAYAEFEHRR